MPKRSFYVRDSELDDFQVQVIERRTDSSFIVKGCAGSGKSILALWKAKQIQDENKGSYQFIVFTKALKQYMDDGISQVGINSNNVDYHWNWNRRGCPNSDYIIVDEAQDFTKEDILMFKSKARKALLLYGDSAQQLYEFIQDRQTISMEDIAVVTRFPTEQLVFNHRLPKKIARLAEHINGERDNLERRCQVEGNEMPKILRFNSFEQQLDSIMNIIRTRHFEDVGILFRHNDTVERAYYYFRNKGFNVEAKFGKHIDLNFNSDNPKLLTYHSAKGLQFEAVFIPECNVNGGSEERNPLYVAITRTYQSLYILHSGALSPFFADVPTNVYETSLSSGQTVQL